MMPGIRRALRLGALVLALPAGLDAQFHNSSTRAVGMAGGFTAAARGYEAIAWNPGLLGMPGRPSFSINVVQVSGRLGSNSIGLGEFNKYSEKFLTRADKDTLLDLIRQGDPNRPLTFNLEVGGTGLALQLGNFAASVSGGIVADAGVSSDAVELLLYGNVTRKAPGQTYRGAGTALRGWGAGTFAAAYGHRIPVPVGTLAVGGTVKLTGGVIVARAEDLPGTLGTSLQTSPNFDARVGVHALLSDLDAGNVNGSAFGLDVGGAYELASGLRFGLVFENLINTTSWDDGNLVYYQKRFRLTQTGDQVSDTTIADIQGAPYNPGDPLQKALHDSLVRGTFPTRIRAGVNYVSGPLTIVGGVTFRATDGIEAGAPQQVSAGLELQLIRVVPLRVGFANDFGSGTTVAVGVGLKLGPARMDAALTNTPGGERKGFQLAFGLSIMN